MYSTSIMLTSALENIRNAITSSVQAVNQCEARYRDLLNNFTAQIQANGERIIQFRENISQISLQISERSMQIRRAVDNYVGQHMNNITQSIHTIPSQEISIFQNNLDSMARIAQNVGETMQASFRTLSTIEEINATGTRNLEIFRNLIVSSASSELELLSSRLRILREQENHLISLIANFSNARHPANVNSNQTNSGKCHNHNRYRKHRNHKHHHHKHAHRHNSSNLCQVHKCERVINKLLGRG